MTSAVQRVIQAWALVLVTGAAQGCALLPNERPTGDRVVDGWPVGAPLSCEDAARCHALMMAAREGLEQHYAGHAEIVDSGLYSEGVLVDPVTGDTIVVTRSGGCCEVALFRLGDGTEHALGVGYPGISTTPMAFPDGP